MDTRAKILTPEQALTRPGLHVIVAYFDVLTSLLIRRLHQIPPPILAVVLNPTAPLLPQRARAELAASLACIDFVVPLDCDPAEFLQRLQPADIIHWGTEDARRTAELIEHVRKRYAN